MNVLYHMGLLTSLATVDQLQTAETELKALLATQGARFRFGVSTYSRAHIEQKILTIKTEIARRAQAVAA